MSLPQNALIHSVTLISLGLMAPGLLPSAALAQSTASTTVPTTDVIIPTDAGTGTTGTTVNRPTTSPIPSTSPIPTTGGIPLNRVRFSAQLRNGQYSVMYQPESQPGKSYAWAVPQAMGGGWTPEKRSREIAARLELYRPDGLVEMQTGVENGYNTVCVTTDIVPTCRIVFTVPRGQDPVATRDGVFSNLAIADSGQQTAGVYTYQANSGKDLLKQLGGALKVDLGGIFGQPAAVTPTAPARNGIYLKPFLDRADGGTGAQLTASSAIVKAPTVAKPVAAPTKGRRLRNLLR